MAKSGPVSTPTRILEMRGSWRAKTRTKEPQPPRLRAKAPEWLDAEGEKLWRLWWKRLEKSGILTIADEISFARYCQTLARWIKMERFIQQYGEVYPLRDAQGRPHGFAIFPQVGLYLKLSDQLLRMEQSFGLTPASRPNVQRIETPAHGNAKNDKKRFFQAG